MEDTTYQLDENNQINIDKKRNDDIKFYWAKLENGENIKNLDIEDPIVKEYITTLWNMRNVTNETEVIDTPNPQQQKISIEGNNHHNIWNMVTLNVNGINHPLKQKDWWDWCIQNKIDIAVITETKIKRKHSKYTFWQ